MASLGQVCRHSYRAASSQLRRNATNRGFRTSAARLSAHNFTMPAMSPTMTEGNISSWKVKEGDSFSAGDVLLEIETDKAQMDVEAQDDGVVAKIMQGDGSKAIAVGSRIAVLADPGDDISSLEIPAEDSPKQPESKSESKSAPTPPKEPSQDSTPKKSESNSSSASAGKPQKQTYPLYPSVQSLLHQNNLNASEADKIPATGPSGRLLKGDVLAYLNRIPTSYSAEQSSRIFKLGHLDLSNIKVAAPPAPPKDSANEQKAVDSAPEQATPIPPVQLSIPISLTAAYAVQSRIQSTLGTHLPLSTFIARAVDLANDSLPLSANHKPSADELFNAVLGLDKIHSSPRSSTGSFVPSVSAIEAGAVVPKRQAVRQVKKPDVFDEILGGKAASKTRSSAQPAARHLAKAAEETSRNIFSVEAQRGEEKRAMVFLERIKTVLEKEPGRLVL